VNNRLEIVQGALKTAHATYQSSPDDYTAGDHAIVMALLVVAGEIAALHDTLRKEKGNGNYSKEQAL
jgi:hypothetical protein